MSFSCTGSYENVRLPLEVDTQKKVYDVIAADVAEQKVVQFSTVFKLDKTTASDTIQFTTSLDNDETTDDNTTRVFLKVSFAEKPPGEAENANVSTERLIYSDVTNRLLFQRATPHIIACYGVLTENEISVKSLRDIEDRISSKERAHLIKVGFIPAKPIALLLQPARYSSPLSSLRGGPHPGVYSDVLFQVLWTLLCFQDVGLRHNDLHTGNVFFRFGRAVTNVYVMSDEVAFSMTSPVTTFVYDFDRSDKIATAVMPCEIRNPHNDVWDCPKTGVGCPPGTPQRTDTDVIRFLRFFLELPLPAEVVSTIRKFANVEAILGVKADNGYVFDGYACKGKYGAVCAPDLTTQFTTQPLETAVMFAGENIARASAADAMRDFCGAVRVYARPTLAPALLQQCTADVQLAQQKRFSEEAACAIS